MLQHLACIMDGNRRYARRHGWKIWRGHKQGVESVKLIVDFCIQQKIKHLSLYTFSLENFKRSPEEQKYLFSLLVEQTRDALPELQKKGISIRFIGDKSYFPRKVLPSCDEVEEQTKDLNVLQLYFLFCYGARQEIISATQKLCKAVAAGKIAEGAITPELFESYLWTSGIPNPDVIIRTGGTQRLSNFLLYQAAYSELYFLDCLWPEITEKELIGAVNYFMASKQNFGK